MCLYKVNLKIQKEFCLIQIISICFLIIFKIQVKQESLNIILLH